MQPKIPTRWRVRTSVLLLVALAVLVGRPTAAVPPPVQIIVLAIDAERAAVAVAESGGTVTRSFDALGGVAAVVPDGAATGIREQPGILAVERDHAGTLTSTADATDGFDPANDHGSLWWLGELTGAHDLWRRGLTGAGVDIALIDSGIVPVPGLDDDARVLHGPDFSLESVHDDLRHLDTYGHGTHMAGIIAAREGTDADPDDTDAAQGIAPDARLISIKVAEQRGAVDVSQIMAAIDWVIANRDQHGLDIRVLTLAFATDSTQSYLVDPLSFAVEQAWRHGIVVVVAAGNGGNATTSLPMPAENPFVLAVGATDTHDNADPTDDTVATYSNRGSSARTPDVVAPGTKIVSLRSPGSYLDETYPAARRGPYGFRGSGTSQASAVAAGLVALLIEEHPDYTPDEILHLVTTSADPLDGANSRLQGEGVIDIAAAVDTRLPWLSIFTTQLHLPATGLGSLDGARGTLQLVEDDVPLAGPRDIFGATLDVASWATHAALGDAFADDGSWNGNRWAGDRWEGNRWAGGRWEGNRWAGNRWADDSWEGNRWAGNRWAGDGWSGNRWADGDWSAERWSTASWE